MKSTPLASIGLLLATSSSAQQLQKPLLLQAGTHGMITALTKNISKTPVDYQAKNVRSDAEFTLLTKIEFGDRSTGVELQDRQQYYLVDQRFNATQAHCLLSDSDFRNYNPSTGKNTPRPAGEIFKIDSVSSPTHQRVDFNLVGNQGGIITLECSDDEPMMNQIADRFPVIGYHDTLFPIRMSKVKSILKGIFAVRD